VNVLVFAFHSGSVDHDRYHSWLQTTCVEDEPIGLSEMALSAFIRIATHPRIYTRPAAMTDALEFASMLRNLQNSVIVAPGNRHWEIFERLCLDAGARGNLVTDAYFAALAIESGCEWITTDRDFSRFPGLRWRHPLVAR